MLLRSFDILKEVVPQSKNLKLCINICNKSQCCMLCAIRLCSGRLHKFKSFITSFPAFCPVKRQNPQRGRCHPPLLLKLPNAAKSQKNYKCAKYPMEAVLILNNDFPVSYFTQGAQTRFHQCDTWKLTTLTPVSKSLVHPFFSPFVVRGIKAIESWNFLQLI